VTTTSSSSSSATTACNDYIVEIRTALSYERGLSVSNRATVFDALDRLHQRLREAEETRNGVVEQLAQMKRNYQVIYCYVIR
jgi:hypothetical protein